MRQSLHMPFWVFVAFLAATPDIWAGNIENGRYLGLRFI